MRLRRLTTVVVDHGNPAALLTQDQFNNLPTTYGPGRLAGVVISVANLHASDPGTWEMWLQAHLNTDEQNDSELIAQGESTSAGAIDWWAPFGDTAPGSVWFPIPDGDVWTKPALLFHQTTGTPVDLRVSVWEVVGS